MAAVPDYVQKATPNPASNRAPWYANTAPSYAGIFLWIAFYMQISEGTLTRAAPAKRNTAMTSTRRFMSSPSLVRGAACHIHCTHLIARSDTHMPGISHASRG